MNSRSGVLDPVSISCSGGIVKITKEGVTKSYRGSSGSIRGGRIFVDGKEVGPEDILDEENENQIHGKVSDRDKKILTFFNEERNLSMRQLLTAALIKSIPDIQAIPIQAPIVVSVEEKAAPGGPRVSIDSLSQHDLTSKKDKTPEVKVSNTVEDIKARLKLFDVENEDGFQKLYLKYVSENNELFTDDIKKLAIKHNLIDEKGIMLGVIKKVIEDSAELDFLEDGCVTISLEGSVHTLEKVLPNAPGGPGIGAFCK